MPFAIELLKKKFSVNPNLCCLLGLLCCREEVSLESSGKAPYEPEHLDMKILGGLGIFLQSSPKLFLQRTHSCVWIVNYYRRQLK